MHAITSLVIENDQIIGREGGFLAIRRLHLRNRRDDGSLSAPYICDFISRPKGSDAVVVALFHRLPSGAVEVLIRRGLRPPLAVGRPSEPVPIADKEQYLFFSELVAGIIERDDKGMDGIRKRAAEEAWEEAGYRVAADEVHSLGAGSFPSPGAMIEKFWLTAVEVTDKASQSLAEGDGSPMEEGSSTTWMELDQAIAACVSGDIEDCKTEITLRRLREQLDSGQL